MTFSPTPSTNSDARRPLQGVTQIVRFNWPMYVAAAVATVAAVVVMAVIPMPSLLRSLVIAGMSAGLLWTGGSLVVSYWAYDLSPLCRWNWTADELATRPRSWLNIHCGFDESTPALRRLFPDTDGRALDIFDPVEMTEPSITRARNLADRSIPAEPADYRHLPAEDDSIDAAFLMLSAHELRTPSAREALFAELRRVVRPEGTVIVAEHLRDGPNFLAFGPGFTHFHSRVAWRDTFADAGWAVVRERRITPFVAVFVLRRAG